jgi:hypothetical protein
LFYSCAELGIALAVELDIVLQGLELQPMRVEVGAEDIAGAAGVGSAGGAA